MSSTTQQRSDQERAEIDRHKYLMSEKQGYDVGWEAAERDWDEHHRVVWLAQQATPATCEQPSAVDAACTPPEAQACVSSASTTQASPTEGCQQPERPHWLKRLFSRAPNQ